MGADAHALVEDHYALQCRTEREDTVGLVVLLLLSHEDNLHSAILNHILYLLFGTGGIKRDADDAHTIGSEVGIQILDAVLREYRYAVLGLQTEVQKSVRHLLYPHGELVPRHHLPLQRPEVAEC